MTPSNFDGASMRCHDGEIWERLGFSDGLDIHQKLDILRLAQGRVFREKGRMKAATEAVFFISGDLKYNLAFQKRGKPPRNS